MNVLTRTNTCLVTFLIASAIFSAADSHSCRLATRISVENLSYRMFSPSPDQARVKRGFEELAMVHKHCPSVNFKIGAPDCIGPVQAAKAISNISGSLLSRFQRITGCKIFAQQSEQMFELHDKSELIDQTLREQQDSDGESSYWIADDLLALLLIDPEGMIQTVLAHPSVRPRFISDLGGRAFDDLDDQPTSAHEALDEKIRVFTQLLKRLRRKKRNQSGRNELITEMTKACRCAQ